MVFFRFIFGLLLLGGIGCFAMYIYTSEVVWRRRGVVIVKWTLAAAGAFFAVLIVQRVVALL
jgi:hypothetical protein